MRSRPDGDFARAMTDVEPLRPSRRAAVQAPRRPPLPSQRIRDDRQVLLDSLQEPLDPAVESGNELAFLRDGLSRDVLRKLRRGHWVVEDELDLHGMNRLEASAMVAEFLRRCRQRSLRCVRIVHGKGLRSRNREPILKGMLGAWLGGRDDVLAFCQAPAAHGGGGAVFVLLRGRGRP